MNAFLLLRKTFIYFLLVLPLSASLMMTPDEVSVLESLDIESPTDSHEWIATVENSLDIMQKSCTIDVIYLSAILYFSPSNWTIWINDQVYTPDVCEDEVLKIIKVSNQKAELAIKSLPHKVIKLRPHQSWVTFGGIRIVEGDARPKKIKEEEQL